MELDQIEFVSLDDVIQGGGSEEDTRGGFERGGWCIPFAAPEVGNFIVEHYTRAQAFLLGRRTRRHLGDLLATAAAGRPDLSRAQHQAQVRRLDDAARCQGSSMLAQTFRAVSSLATADGVRIETYEPAGELRTGSFADA